MKKTKTAWLRVLAVSFCLLLTLPSAAVFGAGAAEQMPTGTAYVDASLGEGSTTFTFGGKEYTAAVGTNAFKTLKDALAAIPAGGTLWLAPGNYSEGLVINKDVTILGPKAGINPNVKGASADADWTRSPERGTGMQTRSREERFWQAPIQKPSFAMLRCVSCTPFGNPVVPLVYCMLTTSLTSTVACRAR